MVQEKVVWKSERISFQFFRHSTCQKVLLSYCSYLSLFTKIYSLKLVWEKRAFQWVPIQLVPKSVIATGVGNSSFSSWKWIWQQNIIVAGGKVHFFLYFPRKNVLFRQEERRLWMSEGSCVLSARISCV